MRASSSSHVITSSPALKVSSPDDFLSACARGFALWDVWRASNKNRKAEQPDFDLRCRVGIKRCFRLQSINCEGRDRFPAAYFIVAKKCFTLKL